MRWQEYTGELAQAMIVGTILAFAILFAIQFTGLNLANADPVLSLVVIMFFVGVVSAWWALFRLKGRSFLGVGG